MGHHYIPQYYLRGFCTDERLWVLDREKRSQFRTQPKSVANETGMYTEELENWLNEHIELPAQEALGRVRNRQPLRQVDRERLSQYIVMLWKRVPRGRIRVAEQLPSAAVVARENIRRKLAVDPSLASEVRGDAQDAMSVVDALIAKYVQNPPADIWHKTLAEGPGARMVSAMLSMKWELLVDESGSYFTSDNPLFYFEEIGIGRRQSELSIPLAADATLFATWDGPQPSTYREAAPRVIRQLNARTVARSQRFVFARSVESWTLPFVWRAHHEVAPLLGIA
ncbi:DUF4238 domain-containing protein [Pseudoxanthomonas sp. LjRoot143]|uniref:DUF4238 domain-containing protein n=1 Tax=Pseudoxanthomonas sp. LjRoot143 TaxID=3342266 RepID=UPI003ECE2981